MKKIITLCLVVLGFTSYAQNTQFQRIIGGAKGENAYSLDKSREGGYYLAGQTNSFGAGDKDAYVVKTDGLGKVLWAKAYGESKDDVAWKVKTTADSGCVIVGTTSSFNSNNQDAFITKLDKTGKIAWTTTLGTDSVEDAYSVTIARNGDYLVCGFVANDTNANDMLVYRVRTTGTISWLRKIGSKGNDEAFSIAEDLKGNVLVCGVTMYDSVTQGGMNGSPGDKDILVASLDGKGTLNWMKTYGTQSREEAWDIKVNGNTYVVAAWGIEPGGPNNGIYVMTLDTNGSTQWSNSYRTFGDDRAFNVTVMPGSVYQVTGYTNPNGNDRDVALLAINAAGRLTKSTTIGSAGKDGHWPSDMVRTADGGIMMLSTTNSYNTITSDNFYLIRGTDKGDFNCNSRAELFQESAASFKTVNLTRTSQGHKAVSRTFKSKSETPKLDSTLCCSLEADVFADSISLCKGEKRNIGGSHVEGYTYSWTDDVSGFKSSLANPLVGPSTTATYTLIVSSSDSKCKNDTATIKITVKPIINDDFVRDTLFCSGDSVTLKIRSDLGSYSWQGSHTSSSDSTIKVKKGDTLYVTLFDKNGCGYLDTAIVDEKALPAIMLGNDTTICDNTPITLNGPPNMKSYSWNSGQSTGQSFTTNTEKTHKLVATDSFGCVASAEIKILTNPHSTFDLGKDTSFCAGSSFTILGPGALTGYIWNDTASSLQNLRIKSSGNYHLTAFNSFGCPFSDTINITEWALPVFSLGSDFNLCQGTSKIVKGPDNMATYLWSNGKNSQDDTITTGGAHFLIVSDDNGCQSRDTVNVTLKANPIPDIGNDTTICDTDTISIGTARAYVSYDWSTGATTRNIRVNLIGTYTVTVTDSFTCEGTASMVLDTMDCGTDFIAGILSGDVNVYPNPANKVVRLEITNYLSNRELIVSLVDMNGRLVNEQVYKAGSTIYDEWDISKLESGVYIMRMTNQVGLRQFRLIVE
jgi:hypothetical protein